MTSFRRVLVLVAIAFWLGGFTFYTGVVVPEGTAVLGRDGQGMVTRRVVVWLNVAGVVALVPLVWDAAVTRPWRVSRLVCWLALAAGLAMLVAMYPRLDALVDADAGVVLDRSAFRPLHRTYLWISTVQWAFGVAYVAMTPAAWRAADLHG